MAWINENVKDLAIPEDFEPVAPIHDGNDPPPSRKQRISFRFMKLTRAPFYKNPQTSRVCQMLQIDEALLPNA